MRLASGVDGAITGLLPAMWVCVAGLRAWTVALLLRTVLGRGVVIVVTTGIPSIAAGGGICPPVGKLMYPLLVGNVPLAVVLAGVTDCAASFSSITRISSRDTSATADFTDSVIIACTVRSAVCLWSSVCSWPPAVPAGLGASGVVRIHSAGT